MKPLPRFIENIGARLKYRVSLSSSSRDGAGCRDLSAPSRVRAARTSLDSSSAKPLHYRSTYFPRVIASNSSKPFNDVAPFPKPTLRPSFGANLRGTPQTFTHGPIPNRSRFREALI